MILLHLSFAKTIRWDARNELSGNVNQLFCSRVSPKVFFYYIFIQSLCKVLIRIILGFAKHHLYGVLREKPRPGCRKKP